LPKKKVLREISKIRGEVPSPWGRGTGKVVKYRGGESKQQCDGIKEKRVQKLDMYHGRRKGGISANEMIHFLKITRRKGRRERAISGKKKQAMVWSKKIFLD